MKYTAFVVAALGAALLTTPTNVNAAQESGMVCGHVNAPTSVIFQLEQAQPAPENTIVARSESEEVTTSVGLDGNFCFKGLHTDLHTLTAFEDAFPQYQANVVPLDGKTINVTISGT
jgi:hypothetical protein